MIQVRKAFVCKDGTILSVQASSSHYCVPQSDNGPWTEFELDTAIREEDEGFRGFVPEKEVWDYINSHGGLDLSTLLKNMQLVR